MAAKLLSGDNPQIAKGYGEAKLAEFLDAVPATGPGGWKNDACRRIDAAVTRHVPGVRKAVKWNSPMYAAPDAESDDHFFLNFHCFTDYVKIGFLRGKDLSPEPPVASKMGRVAYFHLHESEDLDHRFGDWLHQAAALPGVKM